MAKESPLQTVKRVYGSKEKLVDALVDVAKQAGEEAEEVKSRLLSASNKKLLRLAEVSGQVVERYGSKDKLAESLAETLGRAKDSDYVEKLRSLSITALWDRASAAAKKKRAA